MIFMAYIYIHIMIPLQKMIQAPVKKGLEDPPGSFLGVCFRNQVRLNRTPKMV